jgi:hypothetical protein
MRELGEMVLVGKSVQYVNRINVTAGAGKNPVRPGPAMNGAAEAQGSAPCRVQIEPETLENQKP